MIVRSVLAACLVLAPAAWGAGVALAQDAPACPDRGDGLTAFLECGCSSDRLDGGSIWGDMIYTSESSLCMAALHAGAIGPGGGLLVVEPADGQASYPGRQSQWVASAEWGQWDSSFAFSSLPPDCPAAGRDLAASGSCVCPAEATETGSIWGTNHYTDDSALCHAARHAGVIGSDGGTISVLLGGGLPEYAASEQNGTASNAWPEWGGTVFFERYKLK